MLDIYIVVFKIVDKNIASFEESTKYSRPVEVSLLLITIGEVEFVQLYLM